MAKEEGTLAGRGGDRKSEKSKGHDGPLILKDINIEPGQSKRAQKLADIPEKTIAKYIKHVGAPEQRADGVEVSRAGLMKFATVKAPKPIPPPIVHVEGLPLDKIIHGDNVQVLGEFPDESIKLASRHRQRGCNCNQTGYRITGPPPHSTRRSRRTSRSLETCRRDAYRCCRQKHQASVPALSMKASPNADAGVASPSGNRAKSCSNCRFSSGVICRWRS